ncbi:MAG: 4-alpha-glucanotransferase [Planctomycetota bacterium]
MTDYHALDASFNSGPDYRWEEIPANTPAAILEAMGGPEANRVTAGRESVRVLRVGIAVPWSTPGQLILEDGSRRPVSEMLPADLPLGYHDFHPTAGDWSTRVIVTPWRCIEPREPGWGWAVQLHSTRSRRSWGIGDLTDLRQLAEWSARLGAGMMLINPLGSPAPVVPQGASPYYPTTRRFRNPIYLRIEDVPGAERLGPQLAQLAAEARGLNALPRIDRNRVFRFKQQALRAIWAGNLHDPSLREIDNEGGKLPSPSGRGREGAPFAAFRREQGASLERFATFCALAEKFGPDWHKWPDEYRHSGSAAVARFAAEHSNEVGYHAWLQWLLDRQLSDASHAIPILQDLPIGMDPGGADAWEWQDLLAHEMVIGAPPDAFNADGQDWQLPPFAPAKLRAAAYEPFIQTIRATLRHAGGLRIDHVMGLFRLWWIPNGQHPRQGWYVRYPADDLLGIVALESHRAGAFIVGEDLGNVEPGVRERLALRRVLSCRLLWFEPRPPAEYPKLSMASVTTHDLPTIAGLWSGADEAAQRSIGLTVSNEMGQLRDRLREMLGVESDAPAAEVIENAYRHLAQSPSQIITATLEDAQAMPQRPNMPGTVEQWPNWSLALPQDIETMMEAELPQRIAAALGRDGQPKEK